MWFLKTKAAFTLIELLVVVAVLALLAVVALPNFYQAKTSAQVAQAKADLAAVETGLELYKVDHGTYVSTNNYNLFMLPPSREGEPGWQPTMERLTTPVAYLGSPAPFWDPFDPVGAGFRLGGPPSPIIPQFDEDTYRQYLYFARDTTTTARWNNQGIPTWFVLQSAGPDRYHFYISFEPDSVISQDTPTVRAVIMDILYDPTNGALSTGGIWRAGGVPSGRGSVLGLVIKQADTSGIADWREH